MDIGKALRDANLDIQLHTANAPHIWYGTMEQEAMCLCSHLDESTYFTFNCASRIQAYAVYDSRLIVVTAGFFDFLCRLAGRIVASGLFSDVGQSQNQPNWNPDILRSERMPREIIQDEPFNVMAPPWQEDDERSGLFFYLLLTLFRFVILHEIGHLYYRHGDRLGDSRVVMDIDSVEPRLLSEEDALDAQARELAADNFAMQMLLSIQESELERIARTKLVAPLGEKLLDTGQKRITFLLYVAYIFFAAMDRRPGASPSDAIRMSHPPAAFRLVTVVASIMRIAEESLGEEEARNTVRVAGFLGDALLAIALDRELSPAWVARMQDKIFSEHYAKLYARVGLWMRRDSFDDKVTDAEQRERP